MNQDIEILNFLAKKDKQIEKLFNRLLYQLSKVSLNITKIREGAFFSFDDYPELKAQIDDILASYSKEQQDIIIDGVNKAIDKSFKANTADFKDYSRYTKQDIRLIRERAADGFIESRMKPKEGLSLSQKIWNYTRQAKAEFEAGMSEILEDGLLEGMSAEELGRKLRNKLKVPDMVYRRYHLKKQTLSGKKDVVEWRRKVIDGNGNVRYIKEDLEKVGRGVYRSSRKNALRLTATEINMAYRYADYVRWNSEPFVIGFRIELSDNHTINGVPFHDMCDDLVGVYPKTFKWSGWHPRCRCIATSVLVDEDEMEKISELSEQDYANYRSPNLIKKMPETYNEYVEKEKERILASMDRGTTPYWVRDNYKNGDIRRKFVWERIGKTKFKTQAQKDAIQKTWDERKRRNAIEAARVKRHEKRDAKAIQEAWDKRKARYQRIERTASAVWALARRSYKNIDYSNLVWLTNRRKYNLMKQEYKRLAKEIAKINKERRDYENEIVAYLESISTDLLAKAKQKESYASLYAQAKNGKYHHIGSQEAVEIDGVKRNVDEYATERKILIRTVKSNTIANRQAFSVEDIVEALDSLPTILSASVDSIELCDFYNPYDSYWAKKYKIKNFRSYATGGVGNIRFYRNRDNGIDLYDNSLGVLKGTLYHEAAHNLDHTLNRISGSELWALATEYDRIASGNNSVSSYGEKALSEDFAESVKEYILNPQRMKDKFPRRYAILKAILNLK